MVVGSDLRADLRVAHPLIARAHLLLRFDHGRWIAVDNNSLNGVFLNGQRVPMVDIRDGQTINIDKLVPGPTSPKDQHWAHKPSAWLFDMAMLGVLCVVYSAIVWWKIRLKRH